MEKKSKPFSRPFLFPFAKFWFGLYARIVLGYRKKSKFRIRKGEKIVALSNHQTDLDPFLIMLSFNKMLRTLTTDNIFAGKKAAKWMTYLGAIPKRKGLADLKSAMEMMKCANNGDSILFFPEGNRCFADFQFYISDRIGKMLKSFKATIVLFNLHGGFGKSPRMGSKRRKGKFYGEIKNILHYEEYKDLDDITLYNIVKENLRVIDSESGELYKSKARAEYFERLFFICPKCHSISSIYSKGNFIKCHKCGMEIEYTEDLHLKSKDVEFTKLVEYYNWQKRFVKEHDFSKTEKIFEDEHVTLTLANPYEDKEKLELDSKMILTNKELIFDNHKFEIKDILVASPVSGRKLVFTINDTNYTVRGQERFNAIKYVFLFHKLDTLMKQKNVDSYFSIEEDEK